MSRRFHRRPPRFLVGGLLLVLVVVARLSWDRWTRPATTLQTAGPTVLANTSTSGLVEGACEVITVESGDLLVVRQEVPSLNAPSQKLTLTAPVKLLGLSVPPLPGNWKLSPSWDSQAKTFTQEFLAKSGSVRLQLDRRRVDEQGRYLAYVFAGDQMLNEELLRAGLAKISVYPGDSQTVGRELKKAEGEARRAGRGIWLELEPQMPKSKR